ncbi:hypothetical protein FD755_023811, partial [Muntiacus reevesi]
FFLRKIEENMHDIECLWTDDGRNDRGTSISHNKNLTDRRDHDSRSDAGNKPVERHGSSFQDQLQILESEGTVSECSQIVVNINSSGSGLPPQRTRSVHKGNSHKRENAVMHPSELGPDQKAHKKKTYSCNEHKMTFLQDSELTRHQRIYTGRKAYKCNIWSKAFNDKSTFLIREYILERNHINVMCVEKPLVKKQDIQFVRPFTLERNHIHVKYVAVAILKSQYL